MKILLLSLGILIGGFMLIDGIHVMTRGKYIGPPEPGPWANLFYKLDVNVFKLGPLFIIFGLAWFAWLYGFWTSQHWAFSFGIAISILTLWYLPVGTVLSLIVLLCLVFGRTKIGL